MLRMFKACILLISLFLILLSTLCKKIKLSRYKKDSINTKDIPEGRKITFRYNPLIPYITCESEQELYDKCKERKEAIEDELKYSYNGLKEQNKHFVINDMEYANLTFEDVATWICNDDLPAIANEGVYYLMTFISLGALAVEFNENTDFIKIELSYIFKNNLLEKMKARINCESYTDMQQDSEKIKQHFLL